MDQVPPNVPERRGDRGAALVEVLAAVAIVAIIAPAVYHSISMVSRQVEFNGARLAAINQIQGKMEDLHRVPFHRLGADHEGTGFINAFVRGTNEAYDPDEDILLDQDVVLTDRGTSCTEDDIHATMRIEVEDIDSDADGVGTDDINDEVIDLKKVTVQLAWSMDHRDQQASMTTYLTGDLLVDDSLPEEATDPGGGGETTEPPDPKEDDKKKKEDKPKGKKKKSKAKDKHVPDEDGD